MAYRSSNSGGRRSDVDTGDHNFFKLIEIPFSPFQNDFGDDDGDDFEFEFAGSAVGRRRSCNYGSSRQEYLRSYTFSRTVAKQTLQERMKNRFGRLKAAAWAALACNPHNLPRRVCRIKDKLTLKSAHHSLCSSQRSRGSGCRVPFLQSVCFRA